MSTRWLIALLSVLVLLAGACDSAEDGEPADLGTQDDTEEDQGPQQRLEDAVATTLAEGSAEFSSTVADSGAQSGTDSDTGGADDDADADDTSDDLGDDDDLTDGADRTGETKIDGSVDFGEELSEMNLSRTGTAAGKGATAIIEQNDLYVQADDGDQVGADTSTDDDAADDTEENGDAADDTEENGDATDDTEENGGAADDATATDGQWAHMNVHELLDAEPAASQLLLHDPSSLLGALEDATVDVREGAATGDSVTDDDGAGTEDDQAEPADLVATVDATESDEPALEALAEQTGSDELDVEVWVETTTAANGSSGEDGGDSDEESERIERLAISVPAGPSGDPGDTTGESDTEDTGTEDTGTEDTGTDDTGTDDGDLSGDDEATPDASATGQDRTLTIELTNFGTEVNIEVPEDDNVVEVEAAELRGLFGDQAQGAEPTPSPSPSPTPGAGTDG